MESLLHETIGVLKTESQQGDPDYTKMHTLIEVAKILSLYLQSKSLAVGQLPS